MSTRREREERRGEGGKTWRDRMDDLRRQNRREESMSAADLRQREQDRIDKINREMVEQQQRAQRQAQAQRANDQRRLEQERQRRQNAETQQRHEDEMRRRYGR